MLLSDYVIEFKILPWEPEKEYNGSIGSILKLHPIHADEERKIYFRRQASLVQVLGLSLYLNMLKLAAAPWLTLDQMGTPLKTKILKIFKFIFAC